ncbi:acyl-CoA thioesterase [Leucobacter sp. M11]|uniref:acyl-CoA thioesterase n=1 Tax=Leucobacter sp. M11 TaxID=2993565 RepID=UPI002D7FB055|nr:hotdog domain-containing protein [Leucobacter sp. M11]MEB4615019.1 acyl-CoA thioesterase [Leucobacter sp. M11]
MSEHQYVVRKWVKPEDLNSHGALFGGRLLQWVDEDGAIIAVTQLGTSQLVTRYMSEINFVARADRGDLLELSYRVVRFGRTSITLSCRVVNVITGQEILTLNEIVFVTVDEDGHPKAHGFAEEIGTTSRLTPKQGSLVTNLSFRESPKGNSE